jgi:membrane protein implicated in regulation of membrane protease activity
MSLHFVWWACALVLGIVEIMTGSLYLLAVALGAAAAGVAAFFGLGGAAQLTVCAVVTVVGMAIVNKRRSLAPKEPNNQENPNLLLDVGAKVQVPQWGSDGHARITYRGTEWDAVSTASPPVAGWHRIKAINANQLELTPE